MSGLSGQVVVQQNEHSVAVANKNLGAVGTCNVEWTFAAVGWGGEHL